MKIKKSVFTNLVGQKFGKLTVIGRAENNSQGKARWICKCDCGAIKEKPTTTYDLKSGKIRSCGCAYFESNAGRNKSHGATGTRLYGIWLGMRERCKRAERYKDVIVCDEWKSFEPFYSWAIQNGYRDDLTIDRIDNNGNYSPENCRWATYAEQANNRSNNRFVIYNGQEYRIRDLANMLGVSTGTLSARIKSGWPESDWSIKPNLNNKEIRRKMHESE